MTGACGQMQGGTTRLVSREADASRARQEARAGGHIASRRRRTQRRRRRRPAGADAAHDRPLDILAEKKEEKLLLKSSRFRMADRQ